MNSVSSGSWMQTKPGSIAASSDPTPSASTWTSVAHGLRASSATRCRASAAPRSASPVTATVRSSSRFSRTSAPPGAWPTLTSSGYGASESSARRRYVCELDLPGLRRAEPRGRQVVVLHQRQGDQLGGERSRYKVRRGGERPQCRIEVLDPWRDHRPHDVSALLDRDEFVWWRSDERSGPAVAQLGATVLPQHQPKAPREYSACASETWQHPRRGGLVIDVVCLRLVQAGPVPRWAREVLTSTGGIVSGLGCSGRSGCSSAGVARVCFGGRFGEACPGIVSFQPGRIRSGSVRCAPLA